MGVRVFERVCGRVHACMSAYAKLSADVCKVEISPLNPIDMVPGVQEFCTQHPHRYLCVLSWFVYHAITPISYIRRYNINRFPEGTKWRLHATLLLHPYTGTGESDRRLTFTRCLFIHG